MKTAVELITDERLRQINEKGWTHAHDDEHTGCDLAVAAACYAMNASGRQIAEPQEYANGVAFEDPFPWNMKFDARPRVNHGNLIGFSSDPATRIRLLVKAGALIAAEIDRLLRKTTDGRTTSIGGT